MPWALVSAVIILCGMLEIALRLIGRALSKGSNLAKGALGTSGEVQLESDDIRLEPLGPQSEPPTGPQYLMSGALQVTDPGTTDGDETISGPPSHRRAVTI